MNIIIYPKHKSLQDIELNVTFNAEERLILRKWINKKTNSATIYDPSQPHILDRQFDDILYCYKFISTEYPKGPILTLVRHDMKVTVLPLDLKVAGFENWPFYSYGELFNEIGKMYYVTEYFCDKFYQISENTTREFHCNANTINMNVVHGVLHIKYIN